MRLAASDHKSQYVSFRLDHTLAGMNILDIREIVPYVKVAAVQQAPEFVLGLMNLRGQILTVLDIGILLGLDRRTIHPETHIVIFKHKAVGFVVDQIGDVINADQKSIESTPANIAANIQKYMDHIIHLPNGVLIILNADKVLSIPQTINETVKEP